MGELLKDYQGVVWTAPDGRSFNLKTLTNEWTRKHIGEVKENPKTSYSSGTSSSGKKAKGSKTSSHSSVSVSGGSKRVQDSNDTFTDLGIGGREISLECYFIGKEHSQKADAFIKALGLTGKSRLKLVFGDELTVNVLSFTVKNDLTKGINSTIVTVNFHETSKTTYPKSQKSKTKEIKASTETAKTNIAQDLTDTVESIDTPTRMANFSGNFSSMLDTVSDGLSTANNVSLNSIMADVLSQTPASNMFTIASQLGIVMYNAASLVNELKSEVTGFSLIPSGSIFGQWGSLISEFISSSSSNNDTLTREEIDNLMINDSSASMAIISLGESLIEKDYETRAEAVEAAKTLKELEQGWTEHVENELDKISELENVLIRDNSLTDIVDASASEILDRSYKLKVEKIITLSEDTTIIDIAYDYYYDDFKENPDDTIDYLIRTNGFSDDDFFLLKRGTEVKLYV